MEPGVPGPGCKCREHASRAPELSNVHCPVSASIPELVRGDRAGECVDVCPRVSCPGSHAGQLGVSRRLPNSSPGHDAQLVPARDSGGFQWCQSHPRRHDPAPHFGEHRFVGFTGYGDRSDRRHHGCATPRPGKCRVGADRTSGARRHHGRGGAGHRRSRHRGTRRWRDDHSGPHVRLTQQPDPLAHSGCLEFFAESVRAADLRAVQSGYSAAPGSSRTLLHHRGDASGRGEHPIAVPELRGRGGQRALRRTRLEFSDLRQLRRSVGPGRDHLVPLHARPRGSRCGRSLPTSRCSQGK